MARGQSVCDVDFVLANIHETAQNGLLVTLVFEDGEEKCRLNKIDESRLVYECVKKKKLKPENT